MFLIVVDVFCCVFTCSASPAHAFFFRALALRLCVVCWALRVVVLCSVMAVVRSHLGSSRSSNLCAVTKSFQLAHQDAAQESHGSGTHEEELDLMEKRVW